MRQELRLGIFTGVVFLLFFFVPFFTYRWVESKKPSASFYPQDWRRHRPDYPVSHLSQNPAL